MSRSRRWRSRSPSARAGRAATTSGGGGGAGRRQDRPGRDRGHDHARLPARPLRRLRPQRQVDDGGREPLLGRQEQGRRDLRAPGRGHGPGHGLRPAEGGRRLPADVRRRRSASGSCSAPRSSRRCCPRSSSDGMFLNFAGWTSDILPNENVAIAGTTYDIEAINAVDFLMKEKGVKAGDSDRPPVLRGRLRRERARGLQVRRRQARPQDRRAEDHAGRHGHDGPGRRVPARGREGDPVLRRAAAGRLAGRRRRIAEARRADRRQRPGLDAAAAHHAGREGAGRELLRRVLDGAAVGAGRGRAEVPQRLQGDVPEGHAVLQRLAVRLRGRADRRRRADQGVREQGPHPQGRARRAALAQRARHRRHVAGTLDFTDPAQPPEQARLHRQGLQGRARAAWRRSASRQRGRTPRATSSEAADARTGA